MLGGATPVLIDDMLLRVATIVTFAFGQPLTNATGFFYLQDQFLYLVTSRHVVIDDTTRHYPDSLQVSVNRNAADLTQRYELFIPLYADGVPQWYERQNPQTGAFADVVAVAINDSRVLAEHAVSAVSRDDILSPESVLPLGQDVLILGFPLGFHDTINNLPIVRSAMLASSFSHPFQGEPYFLTDARLHRGMSGSPVIASRRIADNGDGSCPFGWRLLGVHSSTLDVSDRDPRRDERLRLNASYYASLLPDLLPGATESFLPAQSAYRPAQPMAGKTSPHNAPAH